MRLLFYIHSLNGGGAERVMAILMNAFASRGDQVCVGYLNPSGPPDYELDKRVEQRYLAGGLSNLKGTITNKIWRHTTKFSAIRRLAKEYQPDFVISFIRACNNDVLLALLGTRFKVMVCDHTNMRREYPFQTRLLYKILYPTAEAVMILTEKEYKFWKNRFRKVYYMPNPCFVAPMEDHAQREKTVLAVGRVSQWRIKGFDNLMRAWNLVRRDFPEWKCKIAGAVDDATRKELKSVVSAEEYEGVEFIGFTDKIEEIMRTSEIFCLSSRTEGMPMALMESLACGCACIAFDCETGPSEMIEDGVNGILVPENDVNSLADGLRRMMRDRNLRESLRSNASTSLCRYSLDNVIARWDQMFSENR